MTSNRIRRHPAYERGRAHADGEPLDGIQWVSTADGENAFKAGYADRKAEIEEQEKHNLPLRQKLWRARQTGDFDLLCEVVEEMME